MSNYANLKSAIQSVIKTNGNNEITGQLLQNELLAMITTLGYGYQFIGVASPDTVPGTPDAKVFYIAYTPGTYTNFGGIVVTGLCVLKYEYSWTKEDIPVSGGGGGTEFTVETTDLTLVSGTPNKLKFADRLRETNITTGKNYIILRESGTLAGQMSVQNAIYEIRYDFDLDGGTLTIPSGSILFFNGGSLENGTVVGAGTAIFGDYVFDGVTFDGSFEIPQLDVNAEHFANTVDFFGIMKSFSDSKINLGMDIAVTSKNVTLIPNLDLDGNGHTIKVVCIAFAQTASVSIKNCNFDCSIAESSLLYNSGAEGGFLGVLGDTTNTFEILNCKFNSLAGGFSFTYFRNIKNLIVENCEFSGTLDPADVQDAGGEILYLYGVRKSSRIRSCKIYNCHGVAIESLDNSDVDTDFLISNNYISNIAKGGIVFFGGLAHNVVISDNVIEDVNLGEYTGSADKSAINLHGFNNVVISGNEINAQKAVGLDLDGHLQGSTGIEKGENARIFGNKFVCKSVTFWVIKDIHVFGNTFDLNDTKAMSLSGQQIIVENNIITGMSALINPSRASGYSFEIDITFIFNTVIVKSAATTKTWYFSPSGIPGIFRLRGVITRIEGSDKMPMYADNAKILDIEDGYEIITKRINLSVASKENLIPQSRPGALLSVVSHSIDGSFSISPAFDVTIGLARPSVVPNDSQFGAITLSGQYSATIKTHSWAGTRPNNTEQASVGNVYLICPGGGQDAFITLEFVYLYGYKPYY